MRLGLLVGFCSILVVSFFYVRGKFNPGLWEEEEEDHVVEKPPPTYDYVFESDMEILHNLGIQNPDAAPPTFHTGLKMLKLINLIVHHFVRILGKIEIHAISV